MGRAAFRERQGEEIAGTLLSPSPSLVGISFRMSDLHIVARNQEWAALQRIVNII